MVWDQNPLLYQLVFIGSLIDLLSLPLFALRQSPGLEPTLRCISSPNPDPNPISKGTSAGRGGCTSLPPRRQPERLPRRRRPPR